MKLATGAVIVAALTAIAVLNHAHPTPSTTPTIEAEPAATRATVSSAAAVPTTTAAVASTPPNGVLEGEGRAGEEAPSPVVPPTFDGHDTTKETFAPDQATLTAVTATADRFVTGWLATDPTERAERLTGVTAPALAEQLTVPRIRTWNTTPAGQPVVVRIQPEAAQLRQDFSDGRGIDLLLIPDPLGGVDGWIVSDVQTVNN